MKKILMILGVLAMSAGAFAAEDSYLYWMVGDTAPTYSYAMVKGYSEPDAKGTVSDPFYLCYENGTQMTFVKPNGDTVQNAAAYDVIQSYQNTGLGFYAKFAENVTYSSFVVELFNDHDVFVAQSEALNYASAQAYIAMNGIGTPANMVWVSPSYNVPEPNSALMLLLGSAVLALRRRKQV